MNAVDERHREIATQFKDARIRALEEALTPSAETKADYMGEFTFESYDNMSVTVPWTTIKEIMAYILKRASTLETICEQHHIGLRDRPCTCQPSDRDSKQGEKR